MPTPNEQQLTALILQVLKASRNEIDKAVFRASTHIAKNGGIENFKSNKAFQKVFDDLNGAVYNTIATGINEGANLANLHIDTEVQQYIGNKVIDSITKGEFMAHNMSSVKSQLTQVIDGMKLSDRVWKISSETRKSIENFIGSDLATATLTGKPAASIATTLKQYLNEPDKLFRRVRDKKTGQLKLSNPAKEYHPGQGVYRSSYKNAYRLAADQVNQSYKTAEYDRHQSIDFIIGKEIKISNNHPVTDICDHMKGVYPKEFYFKGWHTRCRCYVKTIMLPDAEFDKYLNGDIDSLSAASKPYMIGEIPTGAKTYLEKNKAMFEGWKNKPYFLDNFKEGNIEKGFTFARNITEVNKENLVRGIVEIHPNHNKHEKKDNLVIANILADYSHNIKLLPIVEGRKNPDALVDGVEYEFKTNRTPTKSAIDNEIRDAKNQANNIVINVSDIAKGELKQAIKSRVKRAENIENIWLIYKGNLLKFSRTEVLNGTLDIKIQ